MLVIAIFLDNRHLFSSSRKEKYLIGVKVSLSGEIIIQQLNTHLYRESRPGGDIVIGQRTSSKNKSTLKRGQPWVHRKQVLLHTNGRESSQVDKIGH